MIEELFHKLLGIGLVMTGVCLIPGVWTLLPDPDQGPTYLVGLYATGFLVGLIVIGGRLIVSRRPKVELMAKEMKILDVDEFF